MKIFTYKKIDIKINSYIAIYDSQYLKEVYDFVVSPNHTRDAKRNITSRFLFDGLFQHTDNLIFCQLILNRKRDW